MDSGGFKKKRLYCGTRAGECVIDPFVLRGKLWNATLIEADWVNKYVFRAVAEWLVLHAERAGCFSSKRIASNSFSSKTFLFRFVFPRANLFSEMH